MRTVIPVLYFPQTCQRIRTSVISRLQFGFLAFPSAAPFSPRPPPPSSRCLSIFRASECHRSPQPAVNFDTCLMYALLCSLTSCAHADGRSVRPSPCCAQPIAGNLTRVTRVCARKCLSFFLSQVCFVAVLMTGWGNGSCQSAEVHFMFHEATWPVSCFPTCWEVSRCVARTLPQESTIKNTCKPMKKTRNKLACMFAMSHWWHGQLMHARPIMYDLLALACGIIKRGSLTGNLSQPCRHHNTVRHGYGSNDYGLVISTPFVAPKQMRSDASAPRWRKSEASKVWMINWCGCCHI